MRRMPRSGFDFDGGVVKYAITVVNQKREPVLTGIFIIVVKRSRDS